MSPDIEDTTPDLSKFEVKQPKSRSGGKITGAEVDAILNGPHGEKVRQFFNTVSEYEGGKPNLIVGGSKTFDPNGDHPNIVGLTTAQGPSTAAGKYQITGSNWYGENGLKKRLGASNFNEANQDRAALMLFADRDNRAGLNALLSDDYDTAEKVAAKDWAALPSSQLHPKKFDQRKYENFMRRVGGKSDAAPDLSKYIVNDETPPDLSKFVVGNTEAATPVSAPPEVGEGITFTTDKRTGKIIPITPNSANSGTPIGTPTAPATKPPLELADPKSGKSYVEQDNQDGLANGQTRLVEVETGKDFIATGKTGTDGKTAYSIQTEGVKKPLTRKPQTRAKDQPVQPTQPGQPNPQDIPLFKLPKQSNQDKLAPVASEEEFQAYRQFQGLEDTPQTRDFFRKSLEANQDFGKGVEVNATTNAPDTYNSNGNQTEEGYQKDLADYNAKYNQPIAAKNDTEALGGLAGSAKIDVAKKPAGINAGSFLLNQALKQIAPKYNLTNEEIDSYTTRNQGNSFWDKVSDADLPAELERQKAQKGGTNIRVSVTNQNINDILQRRQGGNRDEIHPELQTEIGLGESALGGDEKNFANARELNRRGDLIEQVRDELQGIKDRSPFGGGEPVTQAEINRELEFRTKSQLSEEEKAQYPELGKYFNTAGEEGGIWGNVKATAGDVAGGLVGTAMKDYGETFAGITRAFGLDGARAIFSKIGQGGAIISAEALKDKGFGAEFANTVGAAPFQISKLVVFSKLPGGQLTAFGLDSTLKSAGRGEAVEQIGAEAAKGLLTGALFHGASKFGQAVEDGLAQKFLPKSTLERISIPDADISLVTKLLGETARVGTITGGTFLEAKAGGASNRDAAKQAGMMALTDLVFGIDKLGEIAELGGKVVRLYKRGNYEGAAKHIYNDYLFVKNGKGAEIYDVTGKVPDQAVQAEVVTPDKISDTQLAKLRNITPAQRRGRLLGDGTEQIKRDVTPDAPTVEAKPPTVEPDNILDLEPKFSSQENSSVQSPTPERAVTLAAQEKAAENEKSLSVAVLYPKGENVPEINTNKFFPAQTQTGDTLVVNEKKIQKYFAENNLGTYGRGKAIRLIGEGKISATDLIGGKAREFENTAGGASLVTTDKSGNELVASKISDNEIENLTAEDLQIAESQAALDKDRFPDAAKTHIVPTSEVAQARVEDRPVIDGVKVDAPRVNRLVPTAPKSQSASDILPNEVKDNETSRTDESVNGRTNTGIDEEAGQQSLDVRGRRHSGESDSVAKNGLPATDAAPEKVIDNETEKAQNVKSDEASAVNRTDQSESLRESRQPKGATVDGKRTSVKIPDSGKSYEAKYSVREIGDVIPSHNPFNFQPNADYYHINDRRYDQEKQYQTQVETRSKSENFDPTRLLNNAPTVEVGTPVIDADGNVLGGNSRSMMLHRVYGENGTAADSYRKLLTEDAGIYGLKPEDIAKFKNPVLVREVSDADISAQHAITELNKTSTTDLTANERSLAEAGKLSDSSVDYVTSQIEKAGTDATLNDALNLHGEKIINKLIEDGVFSGGERNTLMRDAKITADGKTRIERLLTGRIFENVDQLENAPPYLKKNLERVIAPVTKTEADADWNILPEVREAIDLLTEYNGKGSGLSLSDYAKQPSMFRAGFSDKAVDIAEALKQSPNKVSQTFKGYAREFQDSKDGSALFGAMSPNQAFDEFFNGKETKLAKRRAESDNLLSETLPTAHISDVFDGMTGGTITADGDFEINEHDAESLRRLIAEDYYNQNKVEADEIPFDAITMGAATLRRLIKLGRTLSPQFLEAGFTKENLSNFDKMLGNLETLATKARDYGVAFVYDDALPEEKFHQEDLRAGRTDSEGLAKLKQSDLWNTGDRFNREYPNLSDADLASEIAAKLATGQAGKYGWTNRADFEQAKTEFLNDWADGVLRTNAEKIKSEGYDAFEKQFSRITKYAKTQESKTVGDETKRGSERAGGSSADESGGGGNSEAVEKNQPSDPTAAEKQKNRRYAQTLAENGFDVGDVKYDPQTVKGWQKFASDTIEKEGVDGAIKVFDSMGYSNSEGRKTALGDAILSHLYADGEQTKLREFGKKLVETVGNAAQELRAAQMISRYDPKFAPVYAEKLKTKALHGEPLTDKESNEVTHLAEDAARKSDEFAFTTAALEEHQNQIRTLEAEVADLQKQVDAASIRPVRTTSEEKLREKLAKAQSSARYYKNLVENGKPEKSEKQSSAQAAKVSELAKDIKSRRDELMRAVKAGFEIKPLKSAADSILKSANAKPAENKSGLDDKTFNALVDLGTLQLIEELPNNFTPQQFDEYINNLTDNNLSSAQIREIHARSFEALKSENAGLSEEAKLRQKNRLEHAKLANQILNSEEIARSEAEKSADKLRREKINQDLEEQRKTAKELEDDQRQAEKELADAALADDSAFRYDKFAREVVNQARAADSNESAVFTAFAMRELGDINEIKKSLKTNFANITDAEIDDAVIAGKLLNDGAKQSLAKQLADKKAERKLTDQEFKNLEYEMKQARINDFKARQAMNQYYKEITKPQWKKNIDKVMNVYNLSRSLNYSGDLGFILRQGGIPLLANTRAWAKSLSSIKYAFKSDADFEHRIDELRNSAQRKILESYGTEFEEIGDKHSINEEVGLSKFARKIPFVKQTNRAHGLTTDAFRLNVGTQLFDYIDKLKLTDAEKERAREFIAKKWVNVITGKGYMGNFVGGDSTAMKAMSTGFGAPRFKLAQFQFLYYANPVRIAFLPKGARAVVAKAMVRTYTPMLASLAILSLLGLVSLDPEDKEFGKINGDAIHKLTGLEFFKDQKFDILGGKKEPFRLTAGLGLKYLTYAALGDADGMSRIRKNWNAELFGSDERFSPFLRGALNPAAAIGFNIAEGKDITGNPYSIKQAPVDFLAPIILKNIFESATYNHENAVMKEGSMLERKNWTTDNAGRVLTTFVGEELGIGVGNYPSSPSTVATKEARTLSNFHGGENDTPEETATKQTVSGLKRLQREGYDITERTEKYRRDGVLDDDDVKKINDDKKVLPIVNMLKSADKETVEKVLKYASDNENWLNNQQSQAATEKSALEKMLGKKEAAKSDKETKEADKQAINSRVEQEREANPQINSADRNESKSAAVALIQKLNTEKKNGTLTAAQKNEILGRVKFGDDIYQIKSGSAEQAVEAFERGIANKGDREKLIKALKDKYDGAESETSKKKYSEAVKPYGVIFDDKKN